MKRTFALLLALALVLSSVPLTAGAEETWEQRLFELDRDSIESIEISAHWGDRRTIAKDHDSFNRIIDKLNAFTYTAVEGKDTSDGWYAGIRINYRGYSVGVALGLDHVIQNGVLYRSGDAYYFNEAWVHKALAEGRKHPFTDVPAGVAGWAGYAIQWAFENGVVFGAPGVALKPNEKVNRAMLVAMLYRLEGEPAVNSTAGFTDVSEKAYYHRAVYWAKEKGIVKGTGDTTFSPTRTLTREQAALMLYRYAGYKKISLGGSGKADFNDIGKLPEESKTAITALAKMNVLQGKKDGVFEPKGSATRAQAITMLYRLAV